MSSGGYAAGERWCDFHGSAPVCGETYDFDAQEPKTLEEIRDALTHAVSAPDGLWTEHSHRAADYLLTRALELTTDLVTPEGVESDVSFVDTFALTDEIIDLFRQLPKHYG